LTQIRRAQPAEAQALTELCWRSKAYWGYDEQFMAWVQAHMGITAEQIAEAWVYVCQEADGRVLGFYHLRRLDSPEGALHLEDLFIEPDAIGKGYGKLLFDHAVALTRELGGDSFTLEADPNAEPFYLKMGCIRTGEHESSIPGRFIPHMLYKLLTAE
jgi:GNAT superfamily N-acetyltransferase